MQIARLILIALPALLACASPVIADTIALRPSARVAPGAPVTLADIAELKGDEAKRFAAVEIARGSDKAFEIEIASVREKLVDAGAKDPTLRFEGERVVVRPSRAPKVEATPIAPTATARTDAPEQSAGIDPALYAGSGTPLGVVCELLRNAFGADASDLRLHISAADHARLAPKPGLRYEVSARSAIKSDFVSFEITALSGDHQVSRERIRVSVRLLREVCVATDAARRGRPLTADAFSIEMREIAPSLAERAATPVALANTSLARSLDAGVVIAAEDLVKGIAIRRNDRVIVRRELGLVAIELEAIALQDGKLGDRILLQRAGSPRDRSARGKSDEDGGTFAAEVLGNGRAVIR
ncbi:MAG: Chaperone for flagella basal body P-ring formation [Planctomycetota bacterium]|jgi:flagella basal body P-ring formation protein FlgA